MEVTDEMIAKVMADFDFEKVHKVMHFLDWKYFDSPDTPTVDRIKCTALEHLGSLKSEPISASSGGGLEARKYTGEFGDVICLRFVIEEKTSEL